MSRHMNTPCSSSLTSNSNQHLVTELPNQKCLEAYIRGDCMTKQDEKLALQTLKSISASELFKTVENSLNSICNFTCKCNCQTCINYNSTYLDCDLKRNKYDLEFPSNSNEIVQASKNKKPLSYPLESIETVCHPLNNENIPQIQSQNQIENEKYLKYVDSLKISIGSLNINKIGWENIHKSVGSKKLFYLVNYFLEYTLPNHLISSCKQSKINTGIEQNNVKICAKKNNDDIFFNHVIIHNLRKLSQVDVPNIYKSEIEFKVSFRNHGQQFKTLGFATFNFGELLNQTNFKCSKNISIRVDKNIPIIVGFVKVLFQLGCGRSYFGAKFVDVIESCKTENTDRNNDQGISQLVNFKDNRYSTEFDNWRKNNELSKSLKFLKRKNFNLNSENDQLKSKFTHNSRANLQATIDVSQESKRNTVINPNWSITESETNILFGFIYIPEAEYTTGTHTTYIKVQSFCESETLTSRVVPASENPIFDFHHIVPLIYDDELLSRLRDNFLVIEFWHKIESTYKEFGLTKIPLHQLYLAYRNPLILKYLKKNKLPVFGTDWCEPIYSIDNDDVVGQIKVLTALGTEEQIDNCKRDRGFKVVTANIINHIESKKYKAHSTNVVLSNNQCIEKTLSMQNKSLDAQKIASTQNKPISTSTIREIREKEHSIPHKPVATSEKTTQVAFKSQQDAGTQTDIKKNTKSSTNLDMESKQPTDNNITKELLASFLHQIMNERHQNSLVENSTNTEPQQNAYLVEKNIPEAHMETNVQLKKTSDLLDSLEKAISVDNTQNLQNFTGNKEYFKASVAIISANHLPSRKRCKSKRSKSIANKNEENILPSCYISFENIPEESLKVTPIIFRSTNPTWNFKCNVDLPLELLKNPQKKLIFKVWRKLNSTVTTPNMQADTMIGFAALDLTVLLSGLPNIQGWFNIVDFSGKCNGQLNIHVTPLEDLTKYKADRSNNFSDNITTNINEDAQNPLIDEPSETFSRALKRKFTELDEITQRLRLRLSKVMEEDSDGSNDGVADQFEKDINTLSIEEDFDLVNFDEETMKFNKNGSEDEKNSNSDTNLLMTNSNNEIVPENVVVIESSKASTTKTESTDQSSDETVNNSHTSFEQTLITGKQQINSLLEKLTLLTTEGNTRNHPISNCSMPENMDECIDTEAILNELQHTSRPNIQSSLLDIAEMREIYDSLEHSNSENANTATSSNSDTSLITNFSDCRLAPDGQGNTSDESPVQTKKSS